MKTGIVLAALGLAAAAPALASGDAAEGEKIFTKCKSCHMIVADDGTEIQKGGKTGPNLYGVIGRTAGTYPEFKYSDSMAAAGEAGLVWDEEQFTAYVQDPTAYLKAYLGDDKARGKMTFKLKDGMADIFAYLVSVGPAAAADGAAPASEAATN
jgi:cytochrome c